MDLGFRKNFIGASEVSAILGRHPFSDQQSLYDVKVGAVEKKSGVAMRLGSYLEEGLSRFFADKLGAKIKSEQERFTRDRAMATIDLKISGGSYKSRAFDIAILEIKTIGFTGHLPYHDAYGRGGTAEVPPHVFDQVQQQMELADIGTAFVGLLRGHDGKGATLYRISRDEKYGAMLVGECQWFFDQYITPGIRPGSEQDTYKEPMW